MKEIKEAVLACLRGKLPRADVLAAYPAAKKRPTERPAVTVGVEGVDLAPAGFGALAGRENGHPLLGGGATLTLRMDIYVPGPPDEGGECDGIWEAVCAALLEQASAFGVTRIWREGLVWDDAAGASRLTARAALGVAVIPRVRAETDESPPVTALRVRAGTVT